MRRSLILLLFSLTLAESSPSQKGLIINLDNGEICAMSSQCKSKCCHIPEGSFLARCGNKAAENQACSRKFHLFGYYQKCPCEEGLFCDAERTIVGTIINKDFGICQDPAKQYKMTEENH